MISKNDFIDYIHHQYYHLSSKQRKVFRPYSTSILYNSISITRTHISIISFCRFLSHVLSGVGYVGGVTNLKQGHSIQMTPSSTTSSDNNNLLIPGKKKILVVHCTKNAHTLKKYMDTFKRFFKFTKKMQSGHSTLPN